MKVRKVAIVLLVVLLAAGSAGAWFVVRNNRHRDGAILLSGNIETNEVGMSFKVPGHVVQRLVDEGDKVYRGQLIAKLDTDDLQAEVALRRAELAAAKANLAELVAGSRPQEIKSAEAQLAAAEADKNRLQKEFARAQDLLPSRAISQEQYDQAAAARDVALHRWQQAVEQLKLVKEGPRQETKDQAAARVKQAEAALKLAETRLGYAQIYAPLDGVVLSKNVEPGEYVPPGMPVVTVAEIKSVWLRAYVSERDIGRVKYRQAAEVTTDSHPGKVYPGRVSFISEEAEFTPKSVQTEKERVKLVYRIKIDIDNPDAELKPGMPADARLEE